MFSVLNHIIYLNLSGLNKLMLWGKNIHVWVMMKYDSYSLLNSVQIYLILKGQTVSHHSFHSMPSKKPGN